MVATTITELATIKTPPIAKRKTRSSNLRKKKKKLRLDLSIELMDKM